MDNTTYIQLELQTLRQLEQFCQMGDKEVLELTLTLMKKRYAALADYCYKMAKDDYLGVEVKLK